MSEICAVNAVRAKLLATIAFSNLGVPVRELQKGGNGEVLVLTDIATSRLMNLQGSSQYATERIQIQAFAQSATRARIIKNTALRALIDFKQGVWGDVTVLDCRPVNQEQTYRDEETSDIICQADVYVTYRSDI